MKPARDQLPLALLLSAAIAGCGTQVSPKGAGFSLPVSFAEGRNEQAKPVVAPIGASSEAAPEPKDHGGPPDPQPLVTDQYIRYQFRYEKRVLSLLSAQPFEMKQPVESARQLGRFAVELWIGRELVERIRFDFPLLVEDPSADAPAPFERGATVDHTVLVPRSERATRAILVDRAGSRWRLPWPQDRPETGVRVLSKEP